MEVLFRLRFGNFHQGQKKYGYGRTDNHPPKSEGCESGDNGEKDDEFVDLFLGFDQFLVDDFDNDRFDKGIGNHGDDNDRIEGDEDRIFGISQSEFKKTEGEPHNHSTDDRDEGSKSVHDPKEQTVVPHVFDGNAKQSPLKHRCGENRIEDNAHGRAHFEHDEGAFLLRKVGGAFKKFKDIPAIVMGDKIKDQNKKGPREKGHRKTTDLRSVCDDMLRERRRVKSGQRGFDFCFNTRKGRGQMGEELTEFMFHRTHQNRIKILHHHGEMKQKIAQWGEKEDTQGKGR